MFGITQEQIAAFGSKLLMVVGGFAAGYLLAMLAGIGYDKMLSKKPSSPLLHTWARRLGGLLGALIVAFLVFRGGGFGTGNGGSGGGTANSTAPGTGTIGGTSTSTSQSTAAKPSERRIDIEAIRVTIYAGDEVEKGTERFYRLDGEGSNVDRGRVLAVAADRKREGSKSVVVVYSFGREAGTKTIAFADLETDLKQLKIQFLSDEEYREFARKGQ